MKSKHIDLTNASPEPTLHNTGLTKANVEAETDKAILVNVPRPPIPVWLPKSQVTWLDGVIRVPAWLAKKLPE